MMKRLLPALIVLGIVVVLPLVVVGGGAVGLFAAARLGVAPAAELLRVATDRIAAPSVARAEEPAPPTSGIMYETEERVVNLADPGGLRYLKAQVVLEFAVDGAPGSDALAPEVYKERQEELKQELLGRAPVIDDLITTILSSKTSAELLTPDGKASLKQELKDRLSEAAGDKHLINVYLTKLIIQ